MARRILIVHAFDAAVLQVAEQEGIGEIVLGVPPRLREVLDGVTLPYVYEEPEPYVDVEQDTEFQALAQLLGPDWSGSEAAWGGLTAAQKAEHNRVRSNALRRAVLWLYRYQVAREVE